MARIAVDSASRTPPWRQVRDQILAQIDEGHLAVGTRLPPIRQLAADLGVAPGTVARAYKELEAEGVLHTARRHGTVVAAALPGRDDPLRTAAETYAATARELGVDVRTALATVQLAFDLTAGTPPKRPAR
ncbi:GntR family transcriptional regulator [Actinopolymorpha sp. B17G11]|uniref:GntR family transcriptional regulator n=1 Tax=Actinopolymorpha sp. B17G11 TaxID=3160861 RepID=UPI0032E36974